MQGDGHRRREPAVMLTTLTASAQVEKYDLNNDGKVNVADAMIIVRYITNGESPSTDTADKLHKITFEVTEKPLISGAGASKAGMRKAPEITTSTLSKFFINMTFNDGDWWATERSDTYLTEDGHYENNGTWPADADEVNIYAYHLNYKENTCFFDMEEDTGEGFLRVTTKESSNDQCDVVVAKATDTWTNCKGKVRLEFQHICSALQFSVKKTASLADYTVEVNQIKLCNISNFGRYSIDNNQWTFDSETYSNYTLQAYKNGAAGDITVTAEEQTLGNGDKDYLFLIPQNITGMEKGTAISTADAGKQAYLEIQCKIHDKDGNYKVGYGQDYGKVYLPFSVSLWDEE